MLKVGEKLGGHFVLGHIDCESRIKSLQKKSNSINLSINCPARFKNFFVDKGSIALEGISLTIQKVYSSYFSVSIIPYTWEQTNLKYKRTGDWLNIEFDYLLKSK